MVKVLIADKISLQAIDIFKQRGVDTDVIYDLSESELIKIIGNYDGLAVRSSTKATKAVIEAGAKGLLKVIGRAGIGIDNVDKDAATESGIVVMNTPFGNSNTTAEHAITLLMSLARQIPTANQSTHAGKWEKSKFMGVEIHSKTLGLVGAGNIGSLVASLAIGLKMRVIAFDPFLNEERARELNVRKVEFDELLEKADFISIHTPLTEKTKNLFNAETLAKCKKGCRIINCARGGIIDEAALAAALDSGHIAGAALDVFATEPAKENPLFGRENVICTPHLGASTSEAQEKVALQLAEQMSDYLLLGSIMNAVNMPSITAEEAPILKPYMELAKLMGSFIGQINQGSITEIRISYCGQAGDINIKPISQLMIANLLGPSMDGVNMVNAQLMANKRGITVFEEKISISKDYTKLIKLTVATNKDIYTISGTIYGADMPRIIEIGGITVELALSGHVLYVINNDKPGLIGQLGTVIGNAGLNIATFALGREKEGGNALAMMMLDEKPTDSLLEALRNIKHVRRATPLFFKGSN